MTSVMLREFILFQEGRLAARHLTFPSSFSLRQFPNSSSCATSSFSLRRSSSSLNQSSPAPHESSIVSVIPCFFVTSVAGEPQGVFRFGMSGNNEINHVAGVYTFSGAPFSGESLVLSELVLPHILWLRTKQCAERTALC